MHKLQFLLVAICAMGFSNAADDQPEGRKYALLVGVQKYDKTGLRNLKFCENDVSELATLLSSKGFDYHVTLLTWTEAQNHLDRDDILPTAENIRAQLQFALQNRRPQDTVLIAFAGHGVELKAKAPTGDDKDKLAEKMYFCPAKCKLGKLDTLISVDDIYTELKDCRANSKILLVDACRNDPVDGENDDTRSAVNNQLASVTRPMLADPPGGTVAMFSCSKGQVARESKERNHGFMFHYLIQGLKANPKVMNEKTKEVGWMKLAAYVADEVRDTVHDEFDGAIQTPEIKGTSINLVIGKIEGRPKEITIDLGGGGTMDFVYVPVEKGIGQFKLSFRDVNFKPYYIGKYSVTVEQFRRFVSMTKYRTDAEKNSIHISGIKGNIYEEGFLSKHPDDLHPPNWLNPGFPQDPNHPVVQVSRNDAKAFVQWAASITGASVHVADYDQLNFARSGPECVTYPWGNKFDSSKCNHADASLKNAGLRAVSWAEDGFKLRPIKTADDNDGYAYTSPIGAFENQSWCGAFDLYGNVADAANDGNVTDGATWMTSHAMGVMNDSSWPDIGFRLAIELDDEQSR